MKVSEIGEFGLIDRLNRMIDRAGLNRPHPGLLIGIGDDTAAWKCSGKIQLGTVDSMVENVHFTLETTTWRELGWKSLAINLSDIAAMGGAPRYALIAMSLPEETEVEDIARLYRGMIEIAGKFGMGIIGGNISRAPQVSITITVIGESTDEQILKRSAAKPGDAIAVTGWPGSAAAGLAMLKRKLRFKPSAASFFKNAFLRPVPRITEGQLLLKSGVTTCIDTSDGLLADLLHICEASEVSARIDTDNVPLHEMLKANFGEKAIEMALSGGEDYELLFTARPGLILKIKDKIDCPVSIIGEITGGKPGKIDIVSSGGKAVKIKKAGWTHF